MSGFFDFNDEEEQRDVRRGPVPAGSRVLVKMELVMPEYADDNDRYVAVAKSGLKQLRAKMTVATGTYEGVWWMENITLPARMQSIQLDERKAISCRIGGAMLRAIVEANRRIDPKDKGFEASRKRQINGWFDIDGATFPARLIIDNQPYEKNGNTFWNNRVGRVLPCTDPEYAEIMAGKEFITDGAVTVDVVKRNASTAEAFPDRAEPKWGFPASGTGNPFAGAADDVPF